MKRDSRFEVLRIISMFFILLFHFAFYSQPWQTTGYSFWSFAQLSSILGLGKLGVFLFVMITGYFMGGKLYSLKAGIKKAITIWLEVIFYTVIIFVLGMRFHLVTVIKKEALLSFLPFINSMYWFVDAYIVLMLLVHFINKALQGFKQSEFVMLILILAVLVCGLSPLNSTIFVNELQFGYILPAYLIGAYLRRYQISYRYPLLKAVLVYLLAVFGATILYVFGKTTYITFFYYGIFQLIVATYIFDAVINVKPFHSQAINTVSKTVFASYLITDNEIIKRYLWNLPVFHNSSHTLSTTIVIAGIFLLLLMVVCCLIDWLRIFVFRSIRCLFNRN